MCRVEEPVSPLHGDAKPLTLPGVFLEDALKFGQILQPGIDGLNASFLTEYRRSRGYTYPWGVVAERAASGAGGTAMIALNVVPIALWTDLRAVRVRSGLPITHWLTLLRPTVEAGVSRLPQGVWLCSSKTTSVTRLQHELLTLMVDPSLFEGWRSWFNYGFLGRELPALIAAVRGRVLHMCLAQRNPKYAEGAEVARRGDTASKDQ